MYLNFMLTPNALLNAFYLSEFKTIETDEPAILSLSYDGGVDAEIEVNGTLSGQDVSVDNGDQIRIRLRSASSIGRPITVYIQQDGVLVGSYTVITSNLYDFYYDEAYDLLYSFETLSPWTPAPLYSLKTFDLTGAQTGSYGLDTVSSGRILRNLLILDYHRNMVSVFDTQNKVVIKQIGGQGPVDSADLYDVNDQKILTYVAFNESGHIAVLNDLFDVVNNVSHANVSSIHVQGNQLFATEKYGTEVTVYDISGNNLSLSDVFAIPDVIIDLFSYNNDVYVLTKTGLHNLNGDRLAALAAQPRDSVVVNGVLWVTHGQFNYVSKVNLSDFSVQQEIVDADTVFLDSIAAQGNGRIYISDIDTSKIYVRGDTSAEWNIGVTDFGIVLSDQLYVPDLYSTIPDKIQREQLLYVLDKTDFVNIDNIVPGTTTTTGAMHLIASNKEILVTLLESSSGLQLLKNNLPVAAQTTIQTGDTLAVRCFWSFETPNPLSIGIIVDQQIHEITLFGSSANIVPNGLSFIPLKQQNVSELVYSNVVSIQGLSQSVEISSTTANLIVNGLLVASPTLINNGDTLQLSVTTPDQGCETIEAVVDFDGRYQALWTISTYTEVPVNPVNLFFDTVENIPLSGYAVSSVSVVTTSEPTELTVSSIYEAQIILNGVIQTDKTVLVDQGDLVSVRVKTSYNYKAPHTVNLYCCYDVFQFTAWTIGSNVPNAFDLGALTDLSIKDRVTTSMQLMGISDDVRLRLVIPHHTYPYHNGVPLVTDSSLLDYRGVLLRDHVVYITASESDTITLDGYPKPEHGTTQTLPLSINKRVGDWTLSTFEIFDLERTVEHKYAMLTAPEFNVLESNSYSLNAPSALVGVTSDYYADAPEPTVSTHAFVESDLEKEVVVSTTSMVSVDSWSEYSSYTYASVTSPLIKPQAVVGGHSLVVAEEPLILVLSHSYNLTEESTAEIFTNDTVLADAQTLTAITLESSVILSEPSEFMVMDAAVHSVNKDIFQIVTYTDVLVVLDYIDEAVASDGHPVVMYDPEYDVLLSSSWTAEGPSYSNYSTSYVIGDSVEPVVNTGHNAVTDDMGVAEFFATTTAYFVPSSIQHVKASTQAQLTVSDFEIPKDTFTRTPAAGTIHPGYFVGSDEAAEDAYTYGYVDGEFYAFLVDGKGWAWTVEMPCANMCDINSCPPYGYVQGG